MSTKVLVFESDAGFAGELRSELGKLGCATSVVDDGNVGLQQALTEKPDLILLSIELPRMNGFSVCNKLKKDPNLKEVPLIIMSSESSDETFEQHKKLRTRAEDYVHKPIAFGVLLEHIQAFVPLGASPDSEASIVIDDEIEIGATEDYYSDEDGTMVAQPSPVVEAALGQALATHKPVDADVDAFAESAFGMLTAPNGAGEAAVAMPPPAPPPLPPAASPGRRSLPPVPARATPSVGQAAPSIDAAAYERVCAELAMAGEELARARDEQSKASDRAATAESDLANLRAEADRLREEAGEAERLTREVDELKARIAAGPKAGAISSREFLDLREGLNKKDKEILALREQLSRKDKEIVESQDKMISLERTLADVEDRSLATERELAESKEKIETLAADKDLAKKLAEDLKARLEKARADSETRDRQAAEARARHAEELSARDAKLVEAKTQAEEALAGEIARHASEMALADERLRAELEQAMKERETALGEARERADREKAEAHEEAERKAQAALEALRGVHAQRLAEVESERDARIASLDAKAAAERSEAEGRIAKLDVDLSAARGEIDSLRQARQAAEAAAELKLLDLGNRLAEAVAGREEVERKLSDLTQRAASLEEDLSGIRQELGDTRQRLDAESGRADRAAAKWAADKQSLDRAKDALAVARVQIEEAEART